ncbi:MAG: prepilin-type N-terminal cleavage/methylation domain-containing protein [Candidatus Paceibacteria bacterium]|jgi:prepilin-type N-terminal cleavage/methylation domain-containing protein
MYSNKNAQSGFSLVETLVAITILLIVITGPLTLVSNSARSTNFANDQVMAYFLAQEGLEIVQSVRDNFLIPRFDIPPASGNAWNDFTSTSNSNVLRNCFSTAGCGLDQATNASGAVRQYNCSDVSNCRLHFNGADNQRSAYTHDSGVDTESRYTRVITMDEVSTGQVEVVSTVTWSSDGQRGTQQVQTVTYLFDVYGR